MAYPATSIGNQFPSPGFVSNVDFHNRVDTPLDAIRAVYLAQPLGSVGHNVLGSGVSGITTSATTLANQTVAVVSGRKYAVTASFIGSQVTSTGNAQVALQIAAATVAYLWFLPTPPETIYGTARALYIPGSSANINFTLIALTSAGTMSVQAGAYVLIEDLGTT